MTLAEDGVVTLEHLHEYRFNALLTDYHIPRMDGLDLAQHTRHEEGDSPRLPITAITATVPAEERARCHVMGIDVSLLEPTTFAMLQETLSVLYTDDVRADAGGIVEEPPTLSFDNLHAILRADPVTIGLAQVFLLSLANDTQCLQPLLDAMDHEALRRWAHRAGGVPALLHNPDVDAAAEAFRYTMHNGSVNAICVADVRTMRLSTHINGLLSVSGSPTTGVVYHTQVADS